MGNGFLKLRVTTGDEALPIANAHVQIFNASGAQLYETNTNGNGMTQVFSLEAPDVKLTLDPNYQQPAYSVVKAVIDAPGYITEHIDGIEIVDTQTAVLPVYMQPLTDEPNPVTDNYINIPPVGLLLREPYRKQGDSGPPSPMVGMLPQTIAQNYTTANTAATPVFNNFDGTLHEARLVQATNENQVPSDPLASTPVLLSQLIIPDYITVHLGVPLDTTAKNVRVKFSDYIKNVASSEIYSSWPYNSLVANIHAITTFALNRVFTEWYRNRGLNFDITNSTAYDQYYRYGGPVFENISNIVDSIFNVYAHRFGFRNPYFTAFCNGTTATCPGLSQWGTVTLANQGMSPLEILRYYFPKDIVLSQSNNITGITESYPGYTLSVGSRGEQVRRMQNFLNRIRINFPLIPRIDNPNGTFGQDTAEAVRVFQRTFNLTDDGVIGRGTWNKISSVFVGVTKLAELNGEGDRISIGQNPPNTVLSLGARGNDVLELQFILNTIAAYYNEVPTVIQDSLFDARDRVAVIEFQRNFGLTPDGVVGPGTWNKLYAVYKGIRDNVFVPPSPPVPPASLPPFPGALLMVGSTGENVRKIQESLNVIRKTYPNIPQVVADGVFGPATQRAVIEFQRQFLLTPDGIVGQITWNRIMEQYLIATGGVAPTPAPPPNYFNYTVLAGDSLWTIALKFGTTVNAIKQLNGLTTDSLRVGQVLKIPNVAAPPPNYFNYTVQSGDSLWRIAQRFGTTVSAIMALNNMANDRLSIGQVIRIPQ